MAASCTKSQMRALAKAAQRRILTALTTPSGSILLYAFVVVTLGHDRRPVCHCMAAALRDFSLAGCWGVLLQ